MERTNHPVFVKALAGIAFCFVLSGFLLIRANKSKNGFNRVSGVVAYIEKASSLYPNKNPDKFSFLKIDAYDKPFELFVGKAAGDFKPKLERLDLLLPGDSVDVYYDENFSTHKEPVNRLAYFIDKGRTTIFIKGNWEQYLAVFLIGISAILLVLAIVLKRRGKIA